MAINSVYRKAEQAFGIIVPRPATAGRGPRVGARPPTVAPEAGHLAGWIPCHSASFHGTEAEKHSIMSGEVTDSTPQTAPSAPLGTCSVPKVRPTWLAGNARQSNTPTGPKPARAVRDGRLTRPSAGCRAQTPLPARPALTVPRSASERRQSVAPRPTTAVHSVANPPSGVAVVASC
jgi:hypothetical protein